MRAACFLLIFAVLFHQQLQTSAWFVRWFSKDCLKTWSRCSRWSKWATGWAWLTCDDCCRCQGHASGKCQMNYNDKCAKYGKAYYCQCYGTLKGGKPKVCSSLSNNKFVKCGN